MSARPEDEMIAAWVDGSLEDPEEARAIRARIETDPEARATAARIERANRLLREAFPEPAGEPVPAAIAAALNAAPGRVRVLADRRARSRPARVPAAMAASVALAVGVGIGLGLDGGGGTESGTGALAGLGAVGTDSALHAALARLPSGTLSGAGVQPIAAFRDGAGRACREFETLSADGAHALGIACRAEDGRWAVEVAVAAPPEPVPGTGYAPASGPGMDALEATLDAMGAGPVLDATEEAALIGRGWRPAN